MTNAKTIQKLRNLEWMAVACAQALKVGDTNFFNSHIPIVIGLAKELEKDLNAHSHPRRVGVWGSHVPDMEGER